MKILSTIKFTDEQIESFLALDDAIDFSYYGGDDPEEFAEALADIDVLYTFRKVPESEDAPELKWIQLHSAGADHILEEPIFSQTDIAITTLNGIHAAPIAEYVIGMTLYFNKQISKMTADKTARSWPDNPWEAYMSKELNETTIGILGYGSIGREIARLAKSLNMEILALKRDLLNLDDRAYQFAGIGDPDGSLPDRIYPPEGLHSFLKACDTVVVTVPLTDSTRDMIAEAEFMAMKKDAVLINIARGPVINEGDLIEALSQGEIGGAAIDVFTEEPLTDENPIWDAPNLIISPHISGITTHYRERATMVFIENIKRHLTGEKLINLINKNLGY